MKWLILLVLFCLSCISDIRTNTLIHPDGITYQTAKSLTFHADTAFTQQERDILEISCSEIYKQSSGLLKLNIIYDLDFISTNSLLYHTSDNLLMRAPSYADYIKPDFLGFTVKNPNTGQIFIYIISERIKTPIAFQHVAMHEFLHGFGLHHVTSINSIMYPETLSNPPTCMTEDDAWELCGIYHCDYDTLNYCRL